MSARRIITTLPAATEIVYKLGLGKQVLAVSHECRYPLAVKRKPSVTVPNFAYDTASSLQIDQHVRTSLQQGRSLYHLDEQLLKQLSPTHLIMQKLCEVCAITPTEVQASIQHLAVKPQLLSLDASALSQIYTDIEQVGQFLDQTDRAKDLVTDLRRRLASLKRQTRSLRRKTVFCIEWLDPLFATGHWVPEMVEAAGGIEQIGQAGQASVQTTWAEIAKYDPEVLIIAPCSFPLAKTLREIALLKTNPEWLSLKAVRSGHVWVIEGPDYFSQSGPRVISQGIPLLARILHPGTFGYPRTKTAVRLSTGSP